MNFLYRLYTIYAGIWWVSTFLLLFPVFFISAQRAQWHPVGLKINYYWAKFFFPIAFLPSKIERNFAPEKGQQYILCANHFSYFDIPAMVRLPISFKFMGKSSIGKVPLFGYMFRKLHIAVDRNTVKGRAESILRAREAINAGFNMAFFPEGGIKVKKIPEMMPFRDGAFRLAVEHGLPIVPVSLLSNYKILPDDGRFLFHPFTIKMVMHAPEWPKGADDEAIKELRERVFNIIQTELNRRIA